MGKPIVLCATILALGVGSGCQSRDVMYRGIQARRVAAYRGWLRAREGEEATKPRLEGNLGLEDAVKVALSYNKTLQAALQEKEIAQGVLLSAYSEALPKVSATASYVRVDELGGFGVGEMDTYSTGLQVTQPLFRGGLIPAAIRGARLASLFADEQVRGVVQRVLFDATQAYYDVLLAQHLYEVNRGAVESSSAHLKDVRTKKEQGVASDFDVLRAEVDVSLFEAVMIQQRNQIHLARARLLRTLGASQESDVTLADPLEYRPTKPILDEAVRIAYANRPDLYLSELTFSLQTEALNAARSGYWPSVDAFADEGWSRPHPHVAGRNEWGDAWSAGILATWPLFDGLKREGKIKQERERLRKNEIELVDAEEQALLELQQAILSVQDAEEFVQSQQLNLGRAAEALRLSEVGYRQGITDAVAVTEARSALTRAQGLYYQAVYSHAVARLSLQRAMGILGPRSGENEDQWKGPVAPGVIEEFSPESVSQPADSAASNREEGVKEGDL
jgi:outer membrane protein TolC